MEFNIISSDSEIDHKTNLRGSLLYTTMDTANIFWHSASGISAADQYACIPDMLYAAQSVLNQFCQWQDKLMEQLCFKCDRKWADHKKF